MSTITKAIASVEFQANSRQANAAMESIRSSAKECRDEVERLQADLAKGIEVTMVAGQEMDINKRIKQLEGMAKSYDQAADSLIKGVKAFDELWKHAQAGNIESMTAAQIRAGMNGAKRVKDQLKLNDPEDRLKNAAIQSMTDESQKVLDKMKLNTDGIIQQLERGESVAKDVLEREQKGLMALMDQLEHGSKEWQVYNAQLVRISKGYDELIIRERQLKGDIVTREDAIRVANQNDKKAADDAIKNAQQRIDAAQEVIKTKQEEVRTNQVAAEQAAQNLVGVREEIKNKKEEIAQAKANGEAMKKEARERVSAANERKNAAVKNAKEEQQAYNTLNGEVNKLRGEVAGLEAQLAALDQQPVKPKVDSSDIDELNAKLQTAQSLLDQKTTDANNAFNRYLDTKKLKRQDFSDYSDAFVEKYGLQGRTFSHITAADKFRFPYDMNLSQVRDAATDPESEWEIAGPQAKKILSDYEWFQEQIGKVADQIHEQYLKLAKANAEGVDIEQLKTVANNIKRLEDLKAKMAQVAEMPADDYDFYLGGEQFRSQFGDIDKTIDNTSKNIDRAIKKAIDERFDYHDKKHAVEIQEAKEASELADKEKEAAQIAVDGIKKEIEAKQQSTQAAEKDAATEQKREELKSKLATANGKLAEKEQELNVQTDKTITANQNLRQAEDDVKQATEQKNEVYREAKRVVADGEDAVEKLEKKEEEYAETQKKATQAVAEGTAEINKQSAAQVSAQQEIDQLQANSIEKKEQAIKVLEQLNREINDPGNADWQENERTIGRLKQQLEDLRKQSAELRGEMMTVGDAMKVASNIGTDGFVTSDQQTKRATEALTKYRETLVKTIQDKELNNQITTAERAELERLDQALNKIKTGFANADEVMQRFNDHMNAGKTASEGMAQTLDEKLAGQTSSWDEDIKRSSEYLKQCTSSLEEYEEELQKYSEELVRMEQKHSKHGWLWKKTHTHEYQKEEQYIAWLREETESGNTFDEEGHVKRVTQKGLVDDMRAYKQGAQERLDNYKQKKAEELGLTEEETAAEEKKAEAKRLTNEQMQEGIKLLEQEYAATDHTTEEGIKRRQELRTTIDQMNQEIKESTGEWMSYGEAEEFASKAGGDGFIATTEQMQKATQAMERHRDSLIKTIQLKQKNGEATDKEERELKDLEEQLKRLKFENDNFNMTHKRMKELLDEPTQASDLDELRAAIKRADGELRHMQQSLGENSKQYQDFAEKVKNSKNVLKEMEGQAKANTSAWDKAWSRLKTYVGMYMGFNMAWQRITGTADDLMQLSDKLGEVRKTTGFTADEVGRLSDNLSKMDTRTAITGLLDLSVAAGQLGLKTEEDVMGFTEAANKLMVALPEMGQEGATQMLKVALATGEIAKIEKQMQEGLIEGSSATAVAMEKVGSTIDRLRATSAATAPAITDFVKRVGAVGAQSGISIDQVAALGSTVDALGMRVEMSATALSRMIPAIKNNAFQVAKAIGMAPNALRDLFDEAGGGMKAMLAIFQHIKDAGMDEDSIEKMLGMAGMQEVMKELNQQGARAGIVFAGLSQNVDVLRAHLETAADAYEKNVAIQQEYDKMNETTLAKWQRLKNEIEEAFVSDGMQRSLGWLIDRLRDLVNLITGNVEPAFKSLNIVLWMTTGYFLALKAEIGRLVVGAFGGLVKGLIAIKNGLIAITTVKGLKGIRENLWLLYDETKKYIALKWQLVLAHNAEEKAAIRAKIANNALGKSLNANVILAVVAAIGMLVWKMHEWHEKAMEGAREAAKFQAELDKETKKVDELFNAVGKATVKVNEAQKEVGKANKTLKEAQEQADGTKESTDKLAKAEANLAEKEEDLKNKQAVHAKTINDINSVYGKYLGFMLSEVSTAQELANAREMINDKLRETITLKRKEAALERVENEEGESRDKKYAGLYDIVTKSSYTKVGKGKLSRDAGLAATMMRDITDLAQNDYKSSEEFRDAIVKMLGGGQYKGNVGGVDKIADQAEDYYKQLSAIRKKNQLVEKQFIAEEAVNRKKSQDKLETQYQEATKNYKKLELNYQNAKGDAKKQAAANLLKEMDTITEMVDNAEQHYETDEKKGYVRKDQNGKRLGTEKDRFDKFVKDTAGTVAKIKEQRKALLKEAGNLYQARETVTGDITSHIPEANPWGSSHEASSTDWKNMAADQLVNRRKQMNEFVNAIQTDSDVQSVLAEDSALKAAIEKGMSSDMRTVINWYNTERLKIQDELHARYLTNTGAWMDPKQSRARKKRLQDDMRAFLEELDAYYTERNQEIEKAKNEEEITEAEAWRRTIKNEEEWYKRRAELQIMYSNKHQKIATDEQQAIAEIIAERTGDTADFIMATIGNTRKFSEAIKKVNDQGAKEYRKFQGDLDLGAEKSYLKSAKSIGKYMKFIEDTLAKERPYDGITKNLQENLDKMGILAAQYKRINEELAAQGKEKKYSDAQITAATYDEMAFFLKQAENAWSIDIDELLRRMVQEGMVATAEEISKSEMLKQAVMGQLRKTFEEVQNAVKREAAQIKKDVEIIWNDDTMGMGGLSMKAAFDKAVAQLGQQQDSVSRANSLIGAGAASENVVARLGLKQIEVQMRMQKAQFDMYRTQANQRITDLRKEAAEHKRIAELEEKAGHAEEAAKERLKETIALRDAENVRKSLGLTLSEETKKEEEQKTELLKLQEESQNRLYTSLREWADLFSSGMQSMMEASHAGDAEYYNERAKMELTGKGGPGAGTYIIIDNEGTSDARAHYEYLDQEQALERQREIENENAQAEALEKMWNDINNKLSEQITDWVNASLQNASIDANTIATNANTTALKTLTERLSQGIDINNTPADGSNPEENIQTTGDEFASDKQAYYDTLSQGEQQTFDMALPTSTGDFATDKISYYNAVSEAARQAAQAEIDASNQATDTITRNSQQQAKVTTQNDTKMTTGTQSMFAKMTAAANLYGIAYQAMSNENLSTSQKFQMIALQAAGQAAIAGLTASATASSAKVAAEEGAVASKTFMDLGPIAGPIALAALTAIIGGLMGMAVSKVGKAKSQIAQVTGASVGAGRLSTGMLTYAEGNVNEFTDPASLTPGRSYNVDGADGKTYRAKYTGTRPTTHLTNGPEFHLAGEKGREMIIDAGTTRQITMNDNEIWKAIKTLSGGGRVQSSRRRRSGVRAFADGNVDEFDSVVKDDLTTDLGFDPAAMQASLDRNSAVMERVLQEGIKAYFDVYGKGGLVDSYDTGKKNVNRHGERY